MGDFRDYYLGKAKAPVLTIFIGGNHEASNYLFDLYHGGWVCPNIYFMGYSGVVRYGGLRIGGLSGIFNDRHYDLGYYERPPYDHSAIRSIYHFRRFEIFKLAQLKPASLDIFMSHEWPTGIYNYGNTAELLKWKPFFKAEMERNELGAKPLEELLTKIRPRHWFSAHLHTFFQAAYPHVDGSRTKFMALDKCLPNRKFLEIIEIPDDGTRTLSYDPEWLEIVKASDSLMNTGRGITKLPESLEISQSPQLSLESHLFPANFSPASPTANSNPQTDAFCKALGIPNRVSKTMLDNRLTLQHNPDKICLDLDDARNGEQNPDEIQLDI